MATIVSEVGDLNNYRSARQLIKLAGLNLEEEEGNFDFAHPPHQVQGFFAAQFVGRSMAVGVQIAMAAKKVTFVGDVPDDFARSS